MLSFPFYNPVEKKLSDYIKLSNDISIKKLKERYSIKPPYKIKYDFTSLSDYENTKTDNNFNENIIIIKKKVNDDLDNNLIFISLVESMILFSITYVIYIKIIKYTSRKLIC
jgi:hypothetical protein